VLAVSVVAAGGAQALRTSAAAAGHTLVAYAAWDDADNRRSCQAGAAGAARQCVGHAADCHHNAKAAQGGAAGQDSALACLAAGYAESERPREPDASLVSPSVETASEELTPRAEGRPRRGALAP
jgi:hypothetical protein